MPRLPDPEALVQLQQYFDWGWHLFPLAANNVVPLAGSRGFKDAVNDLEAWQGWLAQGFNLGCATEASRLLVVDFDSGGPADLATLGVSAPPTRMHKTPRIAPAVGQHWFYRLPDGADPPPSGRLCTGVDVKCAGGYVVIPPSARRGVEGKDDGPYLVEIDSEPVEATQALLDLAWFAKGQGGVGSGLGGRTGTGSASHSGLGDKTQTRAEMLRNPPQDGERHETFKTFCGKSARHHVANDKTHEVYLAETLKFASKIDPPLDDRQVRGISTHAWEQEQINRASRQVFDDSNGYFQYDAQRQELLALHKVGSGDDVTYVPRAVGWRKIVPVATLKGEGDDDYGGWVIRVGPQEYRVSLEDVGSSAAWEAFVSRTGLRFPAADDRSWHPVGFGGIRGRFRSWLTSLDLPVLERTDWLGWNPELGAVGAFVTHAGPLVPIGHSLPQIDPPAYSKYDAQYGFLPGGAPELREMLREMLLWHDPDAVVVTFCWHLAAQFRADVGSQIFPILGIGGSSGIGKTTVFGKIHSLCAGRAEADGIATAASVWSAAARNSSSAVVLDDPDHQTADRLSEFLKAAPLGGSRQVKRQRPGLGWVDSEQVARAPFVFMAESLPGGRKALEDRILEVRPGPVSERLSTQQPGQRQIQDLERFQARYGRKGLGPVATGTLVQAVLDNRAEWLAGREDWNTQSTGRLRDHEIVLVAGARMLQLVLGSELVPVSDGDGTRREVDPVVVVREFCARRMESYSQTDNTLTRVILPAWFRANEHLWSSESARSSSGGSGDPGALGLTAHVKQNELWVNPGRLAEWWKDSRNHFGRWQNTDDEQGIKDQLFAHRREGNWGSRDSGTYTQKQSGGRRVQMWRLPDVDMARLAERLGLTPDDAPGTLGL